MLNVGPLDWLFLSFSLQVPFHAFGWAGLGKAVANRRMRPDIRILLILGFILAHRTERAKYPAWYAAMMTTPTIAAANEAMLRLMRSAVPTDFVQATA
jgi:hypothetical protein